MPFSIKEQKCKITAATPIGENHGDAIVMAFNIKLATTMDGNTLEPLMAGIHNLMFKTEKPKSSETLPGVAPGSEPTAPTKQVRFPVLDTLRLKSELTGYRALITWGDLASSTRIVLVDVNASSFDVDPKEGGSCDVSFRLVCHPEARDAGELCQLLKHEVTVSLWPMSDKDGELACSMAMGGA